MNQNTTVHYLVLATLLSMAPQWACWSRAQTPGPGPGTGTQQVAPTACPELGEKDRTALQVLLSPDASDLVKKQTISNLDPERPVESVCLLLAALAQPDALSAQVLGAVQLALVDSYAPYLSLTISVIDGGQIDPVHAAALLARSSRRLPEALAPALRTSSLACKPLAMGLASSGHPGSADVMLQSFPDASPPCRIALIESACPVLSQTCPTLVFEALRDNDTGVRLAAVDGWRRLANPDALLPERMCVLLGDSSPLVVLALLEALATLGSRGCEDDLVSLYDRSGSAVREAVLPAVAAGETSAATQFLTHVMESEDPGSRLHVLARNLLRTMQRQQD